MDSAVGLKINKYEAYNAKKKSEWVEEAYFLKSFPEKEQSSRWAACILFTASQQQHISNIRNQ